jgi:hypothetical protein
MIESQLAETVVVDVQEELKSRFHKAMEDMVKRVISETKAIGKTYVPHYFAQAVGTLGGVEAAQIFLGTDSPQEGFFKLLNLGRLDLTMEAYIARNEWCWPLFTQSQIDVAKMRIQTPPLPRGII